MDLALEVKTGKGRVRGKNSHPTFLDWKLDGVGKIFGGRRGREGTTIQKKWRGPKSECRTLKVPISNSKSENGHLKSSA